MRLAAIVPFAIACVLFAPTSVEAQDDPPQRRAEPGEEGPGSISGQVTDGEGQPLPGAAVAVRSATDSAVVSEVATENSGALRHSA